MKSFCWFPLKKKKEHSRYHVILVHISNNSTILLYNYDGITIPNKINNNTLISSNTLIIFRFLPNVKKKNVFL